MAANLGLAKDVQTAIKNMVSFANAPQGANGSRALTDQINDLENLNSAVDTPDDTSKTSSKNGADDATQAFHPENAGIITLISKATTLASDRSELDSLKKETGRLLAEIGQLRAPLRTALRNAVSQSDALANAADAATPDDWNARRKQIEALGAARFKQLSAAIVVRLLRLVVLLYRGGVELARGDVCAGVGRAQVAHGDGEGVLLEHLVERGGRLQVARAGAVACLAMRHARAASSCARKRLLGRLDVAAERDPRQRLAGLLQDVVRQAPTRRPSPPRQRLAAARQDFESRRAPALRGSACRPRSPTARACAAGFCSFAQRASAWIASPAPRPAG